MTFLMATCLFPSSSDLEKGLSELAAQISSNINSGNKANIAVVEFSDLNAKITELGRFISEELITNLYKTGKFDVIERQLLNKILEEHKLSLTGIIDESTAKELGKILGVEYICSGTITDLTTDIKINARLISTETGKIISTASAKIEKDNTVKNLMSKSSINHDPYKDAEDGSDDSAPNLGQPFYENFSKYRVGDIPFDWGAQAIIKSSPDGYKAISTTSPNQIVVNKNITFPRDFVLEYLIIGDEDLYKRFFEHYIVLIDSDGRELRIKVHKAGHSSIYIAHLSGKQGQRKRDNEASCKVKIVKKGADTNIYLNGVLSISGNYSHFGIFNKLQFYLSQQFYITEIKINPL